jgi:predicted amidohydrolase YtcJ
MRLLKRIPRLALCVAVVFINIDSTGAQRVKLRAADLVLLNGSVYTLSAARTWADTVAISEGRIVYVGSGSGVRRWTGPRTKVINLQGKMLLPGFVDSHTHPILGGVKYGECRLDDQDTEERLVEAVSNYVRENPNRPWIRGGGWQLFIFPNANPHKSLLDKIIPDRPAYFVSADLHSAWVNSRALTHAGITRETKNPPNGRIERDPKTGEATGTLREEAMNLVARHLPPYTRKEYPEGARRGLALAAQSGITSLQDADVNEELLRAYHELDGRGELTARVSAAVRLEPVEGVAQVPRLLKMSARYQSRRLTVNTVKIYLDGVVEAHTAALLEPYVGMGDWRGKTNLEPDALNNLVSALDGEGFQVHVHAIGDRAVRMALDAFQFALTSNGGRDSRHNIAHLQIINPNDLPRFRRLGVVANFQPFWAYPDPYVTELTLPVIGPERSRWLYPIGSVVKTGATVACGSDWPVSTMNVLEAVQVAATRRGPGEGPGPGWIPEEVADLHSALACYTINGAYARFRETQTGSIEVGKAADIVALDRNLFEVPVSEIHRVKVVLTISGGKEIYRDPAFKLVD